MGKVWLDKAKVDINDEFYTRYCDIEQAMQYFTGALEGKTVYCNCDDYRKSQFVRYLVRNFNALKLKRVISTHYIAIDLCCFTSDDRGRPMCLDIQEVCDDVPEDWDEAVYTLIQSPMNTLTKLKGDGSFDSKECIRLLDECDVVITNPPFSLFGEHLDMVLNHGKDILSIGPIFASTYNLVLPWICGGQVRCFGSVKLFTIPNGSEKKFGNICWYTSMDMGRCSEKEHIRTGRTMGDMERPMIEGTDALFIDKVAHMPDDYDGIMALPVSAITCDWLYNDFDITGKHDNPFIRVNGNPKNTFKRILVRRKTTSY